MAGCFGEEAGQQARSAINNWMARSGGASGVKRGAAVGTMLAERRYGSMLAGRAEDVDVLRRCAGACLRRCAGA